MKKTKSILIGLFLIMGACLLTGCGKDNQNKEPEEKIVAKVLANQFKEEIKTEKNIETVAKKIAKNDVIKVDLDVANITLGDYLSGFDNKIEGFKSGVVIRPFIGSIPFIAYIFETDDAEKLVEELKSNANLAWNICTSASDLETAIVDNYVFFVMSPENFDEE